MLFLIFTVKLIEFWNDVLQWLKLVFRDKVELMHEVHKVLKRRVEVWFASNNAHVLPVVMENVCINTEISLENLRYNLLKIARERYVLV